MKTYYNQSHPIITASNVLTARQVRGRPAASFSTGSTIPSWTASSRFGSEMMAYGNGPWGKLL